MKLRFKPQTELKIKNFLSGTKWIGSHFLLSPYKGSLKKTRLYTVILCFHPENENTREALLSTLKAKEEKLSLPSISPVLPELQNTLTLIIKPYNYKNTLSSFIQSSDHLAYQIQGPFGNGLGIDVKSDSQYVFYAGGTGILPFLDFFDYLLRKVVHTVLSDEFNEKAEKCNPYNEDYKGAFGPNFKIHVFAAFENESDFYGKEILLPLYHISKKYKLDVFDLVVRYRGFATDEYPTMKENFSSSSTIKKIKDSSLIEKIFVCGPPKMNNLLPKDLKANAIEASKIMIV